MKNILSLVLITTLVTTIYCSEISEFNNKAALSLLDRHIQIKPEFRSMLFIITHDTLTKKIPSSFDHKDPYYNAVIDYNLPLETHLFIFLLFKKLHSLKQRPSAIQIVEFEIFFKDLRSRTLRLETPKRSFSPEEHRLLNDFNNFMISSANQAIVHAD